MIVPFDVTYAKGLVVRIDRAMMDAIDSGSSVALYLGLCDLEEGAWPEFGDHVISDLDREFYSFTHGDSGICTGLGAVDGFDNANGGDDFPEEVFRGGTGYCLAVGNLALLRRWGCFAFRQARCVVSPHS